MTEEKWLNYVYAVQLSCYSLNLVPDINIDKPREQKGEENPGYMGTCKGGGGGAV